MTKAIVWLSDLPDIIKKWLLIVPMIIASGTGIWQYFDKQEIIKNADIEIGAAIKQTTLVAEHLGNYVPTPQSSNNLTKHIKDFDNRSIYVDKQIQLYHGRKK